MNEGETRFYLREICTHWCTSNVSTDKLAELEAARLIEIVRAPVQTVRLTSEGAKLKVASRPQQAQSRVHLVDKVKAPRRFQGRRSLPRARPIA